MADVLFQGERVAGAAPAAVILLQEARSMRPWMSRSAVSCELSASRAHF